jgi:nitronate monooxygenase
MATRTEDTLSAQDWDGVDAVVAQGTDAGGHGPSHELGLPLDKLLEKVSPRYTPATRPFLLAAGGLSSATSISNVLINYPSVAGVVAGTAFTVATESLWSKPQKELVVKTNSADETDRGLEWDEIRNQLGWEKGVDGRAIRNKTRGREESLYLEKGLEKGEGPNLDEVGTWAGKSEIVLPKNECTSADNRLI